MREEVVRRSGGLGGRGEVGRRRSEGAGLHRKLVRSRALLGPPPPPPCQPPAPALSLPVRTSTPHPPAALADESNYLPPRNQGAQEQEEADYSYAYSQLLPSPAQQIQKEGGQREGGTRRMEEGNIYEEIRRPDPEDSDDSDDSADSENSFFLSISRGRRRHLQLHRWASIRAGETRSPSKIIKECSSLDMNEHRSVRRMHPSESFENLQKPLLLKVIS